MKQKSKKGREPTITVVLPASVARDVIVILRKFSEHKMGMLQVGQTDHATRLLGMNIFKADLEAGLRGIRQK